MGSMINQLNIISKAQVLSRLEVGDTMRVQVAGVLDNKVMLRLPDGTTLEAASLSKLQVNLGDFIELKVNHKNDNQFFVELVHQDTKQDATQLLKRMMINLDMPHNEKNEAIVNQMLKNEMPITQENFQEISSLMKQLKQPMPDHIAFLTAHDIPVNEQTLTQLAQTINHTKQLGEQLKTLMHMIGGNSKDNNNIISQEINAIYSTSKSGNTTPVTHDVQITTMQNQDTKGNNQSQDTNIAQEQQKNTAIKTQPDAQKQHQEVVHKTGSYENDLGNNKLSATDAQSTILKKAAQLNQQDTMRLSSLLQISTLADTLKTVFKVVNRENSDTLAKDIQVQNHLREIGKTLHTLKDQIEELNIPQKSDILNTIQNLQDNIAFFDQLNRFAAFVPIPLNINGLDTTAELYVLKNKEKSKKIDANNATILLSLFTANLGQVEVIVKTHYKSLECVFRSQDESVLSFIRKNSTSLYQLLDAYGYRLSQVSYKQIESQDTANILNVHEIKKQLDRKYSVDIRV